MYIQLERIDYERIAEVIAESDNGYGIETDYSDLCITINFDKYVSEHRDNDYHNGTGEWVTDSVDFSLGEVTCYGIEHIEVKYNHKELEKTIRDYLWDR